MSKSYGNTIPLFLTEKQLKKHINKIKTNLLEPGEAKRSGLFSGIPDMESLCHRSGNGSMREQFAEGIAWGEAKKQLFELVNTQLADARERATKC